jgi:hypothetical protein
MTRKTLPAAPNSRLRFERTLRRSSFGSFGTAFALPTTA